MTEMNQVTRGPEGTGLFKASALVVPALTDDLSVAPEPSAFCKHPPLPIVFSKLSEKARGLAGGPQ